MNAQWLLGWWNLIFILPFALGLIYLGFYTISGWTFGDADAGSALEHDVDVHMDVDGHLAFEHDVDSDVSHDVHDSESGSGTHSGLFAALSWLGVGRVPLSLVLMVLLLSWGTLGFSANRLMIGRPVPEFLPIAIAVALAGSVVVTRMVAMTVGKFLPTSETYARRRHELLGSLGEALYPIDSKFGMVCGRDDRGDRFEVACRTEEGQPPVAKGAKVRLIGYAAKDRMFHVAPAKADITAARGEGAMS